MRPPWILGTRCHGNFVTSFGTLGVSQRRPSLREQRPRSSAGQWGPCPPCGVPVPSVSPKLGLLELNGLGFPGMCGREAEPCLGLGRAPARSSEGLELSGMQSSSCSFPSPWSSVWSQPLSPGAGNAQDMETIPASRDIPCLGLFSSPFLPKPHPCCSCAPLAPQGMAVISPTPLFYQF